MNTNRNLVKKTEEVENLEEVEESEGEGKGKKKRGNTQFQLFMITQELERHIGKNAEEINQAIEDRMGENLLWSFTNIHDGDTHPCWDFERKQFFDIEKLIHAHSVLRVRKKMTIKAVADQIGIEPQYVERPKAGHGAELKMLAYLVHARDSDKMQYDPIKVVGSKDAIPYYEIYAKNKKQWDKDRAFHRTKITEIDEDYIIEKIEEGEIVDKNQILITDEYYRVYSRHNRRIDKALAIASQRRQALNAKDIRGGQLKQAIYVTGKPDAGKSYLCDTLIDRICENKGWLLCDANSDNCLDKYAGEEVLFIDDARGDAMKANQWTRLLDPRRVNQGSARYDDKLVSAKVIIFNSYIPFDNFFYFTKGIGRNDRSEALDQFIRRVLIKLTVNGRDNIDLALSDCTPNTRYMDIRDKDDKIVERREITTEHSFVTVCTHQTVANIVALTAAIIAANQHAGKVTDAVMSAVSSVGIPYNNVIEQRDVEIKRQAILEAHKEEIETATLKRWQIGNSDRYIHNRHPYTAIEREEYDIIKDKVMGEFLRKFADETIWENAEEEPDAEMVAEFEDSLEPDGIDEELSFD